MMSLDYWFMFPVAIGIATVAMASGVEGATFFTPLFILGLNLPTDVAIGTGLMTEVFGFTSGLFAYGYQGLIDFKLGKMLLAVTIPVALLGTVFAQWIPGDVLKIVLGLGLLVLAVSFLRSDHTSAGESPVLMPSPVSFPSFTLTSRRGDVFHYSITRPREGRILASIGALCLGMVSTGLGQLNGFFLLQRSRVPSPVAIGTSVFIVAITALIASVGHMVQFAQQENPPFGTILSLISFTVPGVLLGAQLGSRLAIRLPQHILERSMGLLFIVVGLLLILENFLRSS
ncbi:sulfite exporter TauE/SafE family protein [Spirulina subsalsa FACHB-351]|uniref:Probable membrane transporter protein n=1 Tax=Spirulina subsalsa FACHB-351 TaxID=234711 RepID=A0ABT3L2H8_9CYAN|nr:sulfite exporter TauE/SafE family protein [Spirulina subsalsa]MCW6035714.1 sulfite exporter TauE/SafE family protein [Spirulina subsalsa FACHB-351]